MRFTRKGVVMRSGRALLRCSMSVLAAIFGCAFATGCKIGFNEDVASAAFAKSRAIAGLTISPGSGDEYSFTVVNVPTITIASELPSAKIFYSLDGAAYAPYTGPFALVVADPKIARTWTVSAYASDPEWNDSPVVSRRFAFIPTVAPIPSISPALAIPYEYNVASVPTVTLSTSLPGSTVKYAVEGVSAYASYTGPFAFPLPGDTSAPADMRLVAYCSHPDYIDSPIVSQDFRFVTNVPAPIITPMALPSYDYTVNTIPDVEITCAQAGSSILRSIDGAPYVAYAAPFALPIPGDPLAESNVVVTAYATHSGYLDSSVSSQTYHFIPTVPTPAIAPAPARYYQYNLPPTITLSCPLAGVALYSRVDGVSADAAYVAAFTMPVPAVQTTSQNLTLRAYGTKAGFVNSLEATMTYLFAASGSIVTIAGDGGSAYSGEGVDAITVSLDNPEGLALDGTVLYIADTGRHRVRKVDLATGLVTTFAGTSGTAGYTGNGGLATSATLSSPSSLAVDNNYVYICDRDNNCVRLVAKATNVITTYVGMGPASAGFNGDGGLLASTWLNAPEAIALDSNDKNLYIADTMNNRIRKIVIADSEISTIAGNGTAGYVADGVLATSAPLNHPRGVGIRLSNKFVYIGDTDNHRVRVVDPSTGFIATVAGTGSPGYSGEGNPLAAMLSSPTRVAVDNTAVYISDTGNHRVRKLDGGVISTIAGTGTAGFSGEFGPAPAAMVSAPAGFVPSSTGFYLADRGNGRIRKILRY